MVVLEYVGRKKDVEFGGNYLDGGPYNFPCAGCTREVENGDAEVLMKRGPKTFRIVPEMREDPVVEVCAGDTDGSMSQSEALLEEEERLTVWEGELAERAKALDEREAELNERELALEDKEEETTTSYACPFCDKEYASEPSLARHIKTKHPDKV